MIRSMLVTAFALAMCSIGATGCAVASEEGAPDEATNPESEAATEGGDDSAIGTTSQALTNCATGDAPNETLSLATPGVTRSYYRSSIYLNGTSFCNPSRRVTIVDYTSSSDTSDDYVFEVEALGPAQVATCGQHRLHTRVQVWSVQQSKWVDLDYSESTGVLKPGNGGFYCSNPKYYFYRQNLGGGSPLKYRVRSFAENPDGSYMALNFKGKNNY